MDLSKIPLNEKKKHYISLIYRHFISNKELNVYNDLSDVYCCGWSIDPTLNLDIFFWWVKKGNYEKSNEISMRWTRRRIHQSMEDNVIKRVAEKAWAIEGADVHVANDE